MPSSYSTNLKIELQATGENSGTWGTVTNTNLGTALEQAIVGYGNPDYLSDANLTLTYTDTNSAQTARALVLNVTSALSLTGTRELVVPTIQKQYIVQNNTTGSQSITVKTSAGTGITIPNGRKAHLYVDGTNVIFMDDFVDINGGTIDGTPVGANSASTGAFSTLSATGNVNFDGGTFTFNDSGADKDFRVEGDTDANLLFSDASTDRIGIGTNTPASKLDVNGTITATAVNTTTLDLTNLEVTNIKAKDGTSAASIADSTGVVSFTANPILSGGTANGVLYLNGSKVATSGSALTFDGTNLATTGNLDFGTVGAKINFPTTSSVTKNYVGGAADGFSLEMVTQRGAIQPISYKQDYSVGHVWSLTGSGAMALTSTGLGIGTSSPASKLHVSNTAAATRITITDDVAAGRSGYIESNYSDALVIGTTSGVRGIRFSPDNAPRMFLSVAGDLGIGTSSPAYKLDVNTGQIRANETSTGSGDGGLISGTVSANGNAGVLFQTNAASRWNITTLGTNGASLRIYNYALASTVATFDSSGNLGLGVTPSAWGTTKALEFSYGAFSANSSLGTDVSGNCYYNGTNWIYRVTGVALRYNQATAGHSWHVASGTAGNTISFTQAMTLDASGDLLLGTTTSGGYRLDMVAGNAIRATSGSTSAALFISAGTPFFGTTTNHPFVLMTNDTERARITSGGDFLTAGKTTASSTTVGAELLANGQINTASANIDNLNLYNTTAAAYRFYVSPGGTVFATNTTISAISDQRLKENVRDLDVGLDAIMALKPRKFDWKEGKGQDKKDVRGFIAQEFEQVFPDLIDEWKDPAPEGEEPYKSVRQDLIPVLVKAIQELSAKVAALEAK
jgi:hypothetical protein